MARTKSSIRDIRRATSFRRGHDVADLPERSEVVDRTRIDDRLQRSPLDQPLHGNLELLASARVRNRGDRDDCVWDVSRRQRYPDGAANRGGRLLGVHTVSELNEQWHVIVLATLDADDERLANLV